MNAASGIVRLIFRLAFALAGMMIGDAASADPSWLPTGNLNTARASHTATLLANGKVLVAGGNEGANAFDSAELYDPATGTWSTTGHLGVPRLSHSATLLPDGRVLVAGGYWRAATLLFNGAVLVEGGVGAIDSAERFDTSAAMWTDAGSLNTARFYHTATLLRDGTVLVAGGHNKSSALSSAELYVAAPVPPGTIGPGYTGSWFDPAQSGHGLMIEVLADNHFYASWFSFDPAGTQQAWFAGVGTYSGNTATITTLEQPTGGRWIPNFDPAQIVRNPWGTLTFTFSDCNHGAVDFNSVAGYGTGSMSLTRLTQPAGLSCPRISRST